MKTTKNRLRLGLLLLMLVTAAGILIGCHQATPPDADADGDQQLGDQQPPDGDEVNADDPYLVVVNASHPLPPDQEIELKTVQGSFKMEATAADALIAMIQDAKEQGVRLQVVSAYRSYAKQSQLYEAEVQDYLDMGYAQADAEATAATVVARPGTSEHNTGLAADVVSPDYPWLNEGFADTSTAKWLAENCARHGFILRYPKDKQDITGVIFEPWHFRYVGVEIAQEIMESGVCLEEYLGVVSVSTK